MSQYSLHLKKGGYAFIETWKYDHEINCGNYFLSDCSGDLEQHLREHVKIEDGFTLQDLFILLGKNPYIGMFFPNCYITDYLCDYQVIVNEGHKLRELVPSDDEIEYLQLTWHAKVDEENYLWFGFPNLTGKGFALSKDSADGFTPKGGRINWSVSLSDLRELLHLPIVADEHYDIVSDDDEDLLKVLRCYTLRDIIEGIFWELSFYGNSEDKQEEKLKLKSIIDGFRKTTDYDMES